MTQFFLGTHMPNWLEQLDVPLFVSHRRLLARNPVRLPRARAPWSLDSGGFTELSMYGDWLTRPGTYIGWVRRYIEEIGKLEWASPQDWMCEPFVVAKTGRSVGEHQALTVDNYLELRDLAADLPFIPVLQGWTVDDYLRCADTYDRVGIDLTKEPIVGVGTVCRRQDTAEAKLIFGALRELGINLHGFGIKMTGLKDYGHLLDSADSMAWSYNARKNPSPDCPRVSCANCAHWALAWRERALGYLGERTAA